MMNPYLRDDGGGNIFMPSFYQPSFDFELFDVPMFGGLFANEFGAENSFRANTPTAYADFSLNQLLSILRTPNEVAYPTRPYYSSFDLADFTTFFQQQGGYYDPTTGKVVRRPDIIEVYPQGSEPQTDRPEKTPSLRDLIFDVPGNIRRGAETVAGIPQATVEGAQTAAKGAETIKSFAEFWSKNSILIIAFVALIFLLLFVRK